MAKVSMTRGEAEKKLKDAKIMEGLDGYNRIINALKALELLHIREEIEVMYSKHFNDTYGTIELIKHENGCVELWIGGKFRYKLNKKNI